MSLDQICELGAFLSHLPAASEPVASKHQLDDHVDNNPERNGDLSKAVSVLSVSTSNKEAEWHRCYRWKEDLFAVNTPFMMGSQIDRIIREAAVTDSCGDVKETSAQRKRRKKSRSKSVLSESEKKVSEAICQTLPNLIEQARELHYLDVLLPSSNPLCSNCAAQTAAQIGGCGSLFQDLCSDFGQQNGHDHHNSSHMVVLDRDLLSFRASCIVGRRFCNTGDSARTIQVGNHQFIVPPVSSFLISSFHDFVTAGYTQLQVNGGYDLIVIDPPWNNKSVKRKKSYNMVQETDLKQIPVADLAGRHSIVCMWITNNDRLKSFVKDELFPHWSVDFIAEWFWMKVTRHGEPVCDILSPHKKPYEKLLIGYFKKPVLEISETELSGVGDIPLSDVSWTDVGKAESERLQDTSSDHKSCVSSITEEQIQSIPKDFVFVSVPCSLHSKKPSLADIMSHYLPSSPDCLELFARNLTPGWVSWGNEPLLHQHVDYFEQVQCTDSCSSASKMAF